MQVNFSRDSTGVFSVLQVVFLLQRHTGYFLIQVREGSGMAGIMGRIIHTGVSPWLNEMNESAVWLCLVIIMISM